MVQFGRVGLNSSHLANIIFTEKRNPHYKYAAPMKLFRCGDLWAASIRKHGSAHGVQLAVEKRARSAKKRAQTARSKAAGYMNALVRALDDMGLTLRRDSSLCDQFLQTGPTIQWPLAAVAERMAQMKFLHENTNYRHILWRIRFGYREMGEWYNASETAEEAEHEAVLQSGGWPRQWPWLPTRWSPETHRKFPDASFRAPVRMFLMCAYGTFLKNTDSDTRRGLCEQVVGALARLKVSLEGSRWSLP
jgi:hypothetical protein